ncbi:putative calcium-binding protein [Nymphaea thermarum]|nr:putative calcium-binding protein [Nymphaea thermarum]
MPFVGIMGGVIGKSEYSDLAETKLDQMIVEAMIRRASEGSNMRSFDSIVLKFPKIDESLRKVKSIFEQFDEDDSGAIDPEELNHCFQKLQISSTEEEISDLFEACDMDESRGIKFNEFIVLLCLVFLLKEPPTSRSESRMGLAHLEATFETLVDAFVFLDKNKDEEMDWDRNGMVSFKEFLFAFTRWIGIDAEDEDESTFSPHGYQGFGKSAGSSALQ